MAQQPFLKSIRPVNLLSFGPDTEEIELRPLNILIGPNGCGKSNLIEIFALLSKLPDKDPWSTVVQTGGAREWIWKGKDTGNKPPSLTVTTTAEQEDVAHMFSAPLNSEKGSLFYSIALRERNSAFDVATERFLEIEDGEDGELANQDAFVRDDREFFTLTSGFTDAPSQQVPKLTPGRSVLSMLGNAPDLVLQQPRIREFAEDIERFAFYRDWFFGAGSKVREPQPAGLDSNRLESDSRNLAQVLKAWRDRGNQAVFERLIELLRTFYEPVKDVDTELLGTHLRIMIRETNGFNIPATRLSDGTLRWLSLLIILLDPAPPPVICIEEPELGFHPDIIPTLADLLRDASTRTQLIMTTHSQALVECFSDDPESVCVCEKIEGATRIRRLDGERLKVWLTDYSLGQMWASGQIGGNRW
jgi:predicted ATPase